MRVMIVVGVVLTLLFVGYRTTVYDGRAKTTYVDARKNLADLIVE
jgi:hypothetical protein